MSAATGHPLALLRRRLPSTSLDASMLRGNSRNEREAMQARLFAEYLQELEILQHRLHTDVRDLPADAMDWAPGPDMNSVAVLLAHIAGGLQEGLDIALDNPPSRVRAQEFQTR